MRHIDVDGEENEKDIKEEENEVELEQVVDRGDDGVQSEDVEQVSSSYISIRGGLPVKLQASDLEDRHRGEIPVALVVKSDSTKDLMTIFSDLVTVNFKKGNKTTNAKGRWCLLCR